MAFHVSSEVEKRANRLKNEGSYGSTDDVLLDALSRLEHELAEQNLEALLRIGQEQIERGELIAFDDRSGPEREARAKARLANGDRASAETIA
jgi:Arc/MetJ-type ribon-helix-helix transcriptional regulator